MIVSKETVMLSTGPLQGLSTLLLLLFVMIHVEGAPAGASSSAAAIIIRRLMLIAHVHAWTNVMNILYVTPLDEACHDDCT